MKALKYIRLLLAVMLFPATLFAQLSFDYNVFKEMLNRGEYQLLYDQAMLLRKELYGKNWKTDYFISKALCAAGKTDYSKSAFDYTISTYKGTLSDQQFDFLMKERDACVVSPQVLTLPNEEMARFINIIENEQASSRGKLGYIVNCNEDPHAFDIDPAFRELDLTERLFSTDSASRAIQYYKNMLGTKYSVTSGGRFLFIVMANATYSSGQIQNATKILENAYNFYADFFELRKPDKFIAVYLMNSKENLQAAAMKVHGLTLSSKNIGYSCLSDLSLLGTSSFESLGTIIHELFHLMIRTDIGDIPGWLDEGIACLYETSLWANDTLAGEVRQWRTEVLFGIMVPRLESLIANN